MKLLSFFFTTISLKTSGIKLIQKGAIIPYGPNITQTTNNVKDFSPKLTIFPIEALNLVKNGFF